MGIDPHELEHRNWRASASKNNNDFDRELAEQLDTSIVPDHNDRAPLALTAKQAKRKKIDQLE